MKKLLKGIESKAKKCYSAWFKTRFHYKEKDFSDIKPFSKEQKKEISQFWKKYSCRFKKKFLQYYCHFSGYSAFYIPDDVWYNIILPYYNNRILAQQIDDKCLYDIFLGNFSMPKSVLRIIDGRIYDDNFNIISCESATRILRELRKDLLIKPSVFTCGGWGIKLVSELNLEDVSEIKKEYPNAIVQKIVKQSECLARLNGSSLNTIRVSTLIMDDGSIHIPAAVIRMGTNGSLVDNACSGGVFVGIDVDSGSLKEFGYSRATGKYQRFTEHPNSRTIFKGYKILGFNKIIDAIKKNAKYLPKTRLLGWDFTLDINNSPVMIEVNIEEHELEMMQLANGPYFGSYELTESVLCEVFKEGKK